MDNEATRHMAWRNVHLDMLAMCEYEQGSVFVYNCLVFLWWSSLLDAEQSVGWTPACLEAAGRELSLIEELCGLYKHCAQKEREKEVGERELAPVRNSSLEVWVGKLLYCSCKSEREIGGGCWERGTS